MNCSPGLEDLFNGSLGRENKEILTWVELRYFFRIKPENRHLRI